MSTCLLSAYCTLSVTSYLSYPLDFQRESYSSLAECKGRHTRSVLMSVDGKHVKITPPTGSGSFYWNYKGFNSLVLMSIANANYEFLYCDIGTNGVCVCHRKENPPQNLLSC